MINVSFSVVTLIQQEELMGWHSSVVKRTRIRVFGVNFSEFLVREKEFTSSKRGVRVIGVLLYVYKRYQDQYPGSPTKDRGVVSQGKLTDSNKQVQLQLNSKLLQILATLNY